MNSPAITHFESNKLIIQLKNYKCSWSKCNIDQTIRDIIHPDKTNPFQYIIDQQMYSIYPNPNAATTLCTDYNITSSGIITADNIYTLLQWDWI